MAELKVAALELGTERIRKLLVQYAVPAIIAMTASSLYNMVDSIFIGHGVGPLAISGLALTFPLMNLAAAFGSLVGVGAATLVSMRLGQRDYETAQRVLGNVVMLNIIIGIAFSIVALLFLDPILYFFGASEATIGYAREYMVIILLGNVVTHIYLGLNSILRAAGHPRKSMYATISTVVINAILDPIFIFWFDWGIRGAAIATILAQIISLVWQFRLLSDRQELLHFRRGIYRLRRKIVRDILSIGMSPFLMNLAACFIVILINKGLKEFGGDLMRTAVRPRHAGAETDDDRRHVHHGMRIPDRRTLSAAGRQPLYGGRGVDSPLGRGHAHHLHLLSDHRLPDGGHELLHEHRHGRQGHLPVAVAAAVVPHAVPDLPAAHLRPIYVVGRQLGRLGLDAALGSAGLDRRLLHADLAAALFPQTAGFRTRKTVIVYG